MKSVYWQSVAIFLPESGRDGACCPFQEGIWSTVRTVEIYSIHFEDILVYCILLEVLSYYSLSYKCCTVAYSNSFALPEDEWSPSSVVSVR